MKKVILILLLISFKNGLMAQLSIHSNTAKIYLVRHAEKETGNDPVLTEAGKKRAGDLMRTLQAKNIRRIYVTQFRRTQMTADSMRLQLHIDTAHYVADTTGDDLLRAIRSHHDIGKAILVVGHSNTIPVMIRKLGCINYPLANIPDAEFDNLFLVRYKNGRAYLTKMKYGRPSGISAPMKH